MSENVPNLAKITCALCSKPMPCIVFQILCGHGLCTSECSTRPSAQKERGSAAIIVCTYGNINRTFGASCGSVALCPTCRSPFFVDVAVVVVCGTIFMQHKIIFLAIEPMACAEDVLVVRVHVRLGAHNNDREVIDR